VPLQIVPSSLPLRIRSRRVVAILLQVAAIATYIPPIPTAIAPVSPQIAAILTDVARFLARGGRITLPHVLTALTDVLTNIAAVAACVAAIVAQLAPVAAHFMTISGGVAGLLRSRGGGHAECQREQRGDESAVLHGNPRKGCGSWLRRRQDPGVKIVRLS